MIETPKAGRRHRTAALGSAASSLSVRALLALVLSSMLVACGPGTGGTGTGPDAGASVGPGDSLVAQGDLLGSWRGADALAVFEPQRIRVQQGCRVFGFDGTWTPDPLRGLDLALRSDSAASSPANGGTVHLQVARLDADRIRITVRDAAGADLIGPLEARRALAPPLLSEPGC